MRKSIKSVDRNTLITKYKGEEEIMQTNESGVVVKAKDVLLNYTGKRLFLKMRMTYTIKL